MLNLINLPRLMSLTEGRPEIVVALIDGPVNTSLPNFAHSSIRNLPPGNMENGACKLPNSAACRHGTLIAGILIGSRDSTPAICPDCTLLLRPIFLEADGHGGDLTASSPEVLAAAIVDSIDAGARIINLSCGVSRCSARGENSLRSALEYAAKKAVLVFAAAGNQSMVGSSCITNNPWVIPVVSIDCVGRPTDQSNLGASIGQRGLAAPGQNILSLSTDGKATHFSGTSAACPFGSGTAALLWSEFPSLSGNHIRDALTGGRRLRTIVPPALDAWRAYQTLDARFSRRRTG